jgi:hypothetical protein
MMDATRLPRNAFPIRREVATHLFATGQLVRLKRSDFAPPSQSADTYRITATLPPRGDAQQYRVRNDHELCERVVTQDSLELVFVSPATAGDALIEGTFGAAQVADVKSLLHRKSRSRRKTSPSTTTQEI